jgi:hypothetical protein
VRVAERGQDIGDLDLGYQQWNATVDGRIPSIERLQSKPRIRPSPLLRRRVGRRYLVRSWR